MEQENGDKTGNLIACFRHHWKLQIWLRGSGSKSSHRFEALVEQPQSDRQSYLRGREATRTCHYVGEHRKDIKMRDGRLKVFQDKVLDKLN
jgi:hypothetical protein